MITQFCKRLLDILLPPQEIESITLERFLEKAQHAQRKVPTAQHEWAFAPLHYRAPLVRKTILALKYKESEHAAKLLAHVLHPFLLEYASDTVLFQSTETILLVPIPLSKERLRERGYNQASVLAHKLAELFDNKECVVSDNILIRIKNTPPQTRAKSKEQRLKNIVGCFAVSNPEKVSGKTIVLIDDVITTGATMSEARRILLEAGARNVIALAAAH